MYSPYASMGYLVTVLCILSGHLGILVVSVFYVHGNSGTTDAVR